MKLKIKERLVKLLEIPEDVITDVPKITILGDSIFVENYRNITHYTKENIRISTNIGILKIDGKDFKIQEITTEDILIGGNFYSLEIIKDK